MNTVVTDEKVLFCVYGTLKRGYGNYNGLLNRDDVEFLGTFETEPRFTMVSWGGFPAVHCEGDTSIKCEIFATSNRSVINSVNRLEGYTGTPDKEGGKHNWYDVEPIETPYGTALMFVHRGPVTKRIVKDGNWL
jgi:gamma-glutamylcyclotransferase (GGCT)/AIG2-like uncharacterized protein YtfP